MSQQIKLYFANTNLDNPPVTQDISTLVDDFGAVTVTLNIYGLNGAYEVETEETIDITGNQTQSRTIRQTFKPECLWSHVSNAIFTPFSDLAVLFSNYKYVWLFALDTSYLPTNTDGETTAIEVILEEWSPGSDYSTGRYNLTLGLKQANI